MANGVSVIICCYNSAQRLTETLRHLAGQKLSSSFPWEVVVIDNASTDNTAETAARCWPASAPAGLRVISEPQAGLSHARIRGIQEARYEIISFVDDDNWVAETWVERVYTIFTGHPEVGACGGSSEGVCEIEPPAWFEVIKEHYAIGRQYRRNGDVTDTSGTLLWGAGLNLRTSTIRKLLRDDFQFKLSDRKENLLTTGGDIELCFALRASGCRFWYDEDLKLRHFIPKARLQWDYALRLMRGMGEASVLFELYLFALDAPPFEVYPIWKKNLFFQILKTLRQFSLIILFHPLASLRRPEGAIPVLKFEERKAKLAGLWALRDQYQKMQEDIRQSAWARDIEKRTG